MTENKTNIHGVGEVRMKVNADGDGNTTLPLCRRVPENMYDASGRHDDIGWTGRCKGEMILSIVGVVVEMINLEGARGVHCEWRGRSVVVGRWGVDDHGV